MDGGAGRDRPPVPLEPLIPDDVKEYIPANVTGLPGLQNFEEYESLSKALYGSLFLRHRQQEDGTNALVYIGTNYISANNDQMDRFKRINPSTAHLKRTIVDLFRLLQLFKQGWTPLSRNNRQVIINLFDSAEKNTALETLYPNGADVLDRMVVWANHNITTLTYLMEKNNFLVYAVYALDQAMVSLDNLRVCCQDLVTEQITKDEATQVSRRVTHWRGFAVFNINQYLSYNNAQRIVEGKMTLGQITLYEDLILGGNEGIMSRVRNKSILNTVFRPPAGFNIHGLAEIQVIQTSLSPLLKEISSYTPSDQASARQRSESIKPQVQRCVSAMTDFREGVESGEEPTLGKARGLIKSFNHLHVSLLKLEGDKVTIDEDTVGITVSTLESNIVELENFAYELEVKSKREEARKEREVQNMLKESITAKALRLKKLKTPDDYLDWKKSLDSLLPHVLSPYAKASIVRDSLLCQEDKVLCEHMEFDDIIKYITRKYSSPALVQQQLEDFTNQKPITGPVLNNVTAINKFLILLKRLEEHKKTSEIDYSARQKIPIILLPPRHLAGFQKDYALKNSEWISKLDLPAADEEDEAASVASGRNLTEEVDEEQRQWLITQMKLYAQILTDEAKNESKYKLVKDDGVSKRKEKSSKTVARSAAAKTEMTGDICPCCNSQHFVDGKPTNCLLYCPKFMGMTGEAKQKFVRSHGYCPRCLNLKKAASHPSPGICLIGERKQIFCPAHDPPSSTHHAIMCRGSTKKGAPRGGGNGGNRRGGGGRGGRNGRRRIMFY